MPRRFELTDGKSKKFWEISIAATSHTVRFGRIGADGQTKVKKFDNAADVRKDHDRLIAEKLKKGYQEVSSRGKSTTSKASAGRPVQPKKKKSGEAKSAAAWRARAHRTAKEFNWDYGCDKLREIIQKPCDLGTALMIYWRGRPDWYRQFENGNAVGPPRDEFDMLVEIERNIAKGFYKNHNISYDPYDDEGQDQTNCYPKLRAKYRCNLPDSVYNAVGNPKAADRPNRHVRRKLPVGLAALATTQRQRSQTPRQRAISALNELNDYSSQEVVKMKGRRALRVDFFANHRANDEALEYLQWLSELEQLAFGIKMTDAAAKALKYVPRLKELEWTDNMTDRGLASLQHVPKLEYLNLNSCDRITDAGLKHLKNLGALMILDLTDTKVGDQGLEQLKHLTKLRSLELGGTRITDAGIKHLASFKNLVELSIGNTKTGDPAMDVLAHLKRLEWISIHHTATSDEGIAKLACLPNLQKLYAAGTKVSSKGARALPGVEVDL